MTSDRSLSHQFKGFYTYQLLNILSILHTNKFLFKVGNFPLIRAEESNTRGRKESCSSLNLTTAKLGSSYWSTRQSIPSTPKRQDSKENIIKIAFMHRNNHLAKTVYVKTISIHTAVLKLAFLNLFFFFFAFFLHSCHLCSKKTSSGGVRGGEEKEGALLKSCHVALIHLLSLEWARDSSDGQELHSTHDTRTVWGIENCFLRKPSQLRTWPYWMSSVNLGFSSFSQ